MRDDDDTEHLALTEETLSVRKHRVVTGRVRIRGETETVETIARADLEGEEVEVTRVAVDRPVETRPEVRTEGDLTIFPVVEEVLVVEKRLHLKEEIHIRRRATREQVEVPVSLRRQRAIVERSESQAGDVATETHQTSEATSDE